MMYSCLVLVLLCGHFSLGIQEDPPDEAIPVPSAPELSAKRQLSQEEAQSGEEVIQEAIPLPSEDDRGEINVQGSLRSIRSTKKKKRRKNKSKNGKNPSGSNDVKDTPSGGSGQNDQMYGGQEESWYPQNWGTYLDVLASSHPLKKLRAGSATATDSCHTVRNIPSSYRKLFQPNIPSFYVKYTEAYGIPIIGSKNVTSVGLQRVCYLVKVMYAGRYDVRNVYYKMSGRFALIGDGEEQTSLAEYRNWKADDWNTRSRGLGPMITLPITSAGDDNQRCKSNDRYFDQDIGCHELAHAFEQLGAEYAIPGFRRRLIALYQDAVHKKGKWANKYSNRNAFEYFAIGTQFFFNAFGGSSYENIGVRDRESLKRYDPPLYALLEEVFPCAKYNTLINRCSWKACTLKDHFEKVLGAETNAKVNCQLLKSAAKSLEDCAQTACYYTANVFQHKGSTCHVFKCAKTETYEDMMITQGRAGYNIYKAKAMPQLDLKMELSQKVRQFCTKGPPPGRCNVASGERVVCSQSGDAALCRGMGCCFSGGSCFYPKQDCTDKYTTCTQLSKRGECERNPGFMYKACPMACNACHLLSKYKPEYLDSVCHDKHIHCRDWYTSGECGASKTYMLQTCPLGCGVCKLKQPLT